MKKKGMRCLECGCMLMVLFVVWTVLIQCVDVQAIGPQSTEVGFSELNSWFHTLTGVHMIFYVITDWLGLVPIFVSNVFGNVKRSVCDYNGICIISDKRINRELC